MVSGGLRRVSPRIGDHVFFFGRGGIFRDIL